MSITKLLEQGLPNNTDVERSVLGLMLRDKNSIPEIISVLKNSDFYHPIHQAIYETIVKLFSKNISFDIHLLFEYLEKKEILTKEHGMSDLLDIIDAKRVLNLETSIKIIMSNSQRRQYINHCLEIINNCYLEPDIDVLIDKTEENILSVGQSRFVKGIEHIKETVIDYSKTIKAKKEDPNFIDVSIVKTNIKTLDRIMNPQRSDLIIIAGRPGIGKSSLLLEIARNICIKDKKPVVFFTPKKKKKQVVERLISLNSELETQRLNSGFLNANQWNDFNNSIELLSSDDVPFFIDDSSYLTINEMRAKLRKFIQKYGQVGAVFTDYLQMLKSDIQATKAEQISQMALGCKNLAKEFDTVHYLGSQLSRSVETRQDKRPQLSDLKESGGIEENANKVLLLYRDEYYKPDTNDIGVAEINLAKHREGATNTVKMFFNANITKFQDLEVV